PPPVYPAWRTLNRSRPLHHGAASLCPPPGRAFPHPGRIYMPRRERMNVKVDAELVRKAKVVAAAMRITLSDYISALLRPQIESDLGRIAAGLAGEADALAGGPQQAHPPGD